LIKTLILFGLAFFLLNIPVYAIAPSVSHPGNAIWIEPPTIDLTGKSIGYKFNVTAYVNMTTLESGALGITVWQVTLYYNTTYINATRVGLTGTDGVTSELFEGKYTYPHIVIEPDKSRVGCGETLLSADYVSVPVLASLCWIEFEVLALQPQPIDFKLNINCTSAEGEYLTYVGDDIPFPDTNYYPPCGGAQLYNATVVPEFSPFLSVAVLMFLTLVITIFHKKSARNLKLR
jgi:hypothetical protein